METTLNPTLADGLWSWRQRLNDSAMVISTLVPGQTVRAATELARELAQPDRVVVLTGVGASEPLFWHIPAGKELDTVRPDLVLLLVQNRFTASTRLLLATTSRVILLVGTSPEEQAEALKMMRFITEKTSPSYIEVVVVADDRPAARDAGAQLVTMAGNRLGARAEWRHLSAWKIREGVGDKEEGSMASVRPQRVPMTDAELRAKEWEESFRKAEVLLHEAQETLRQQIARSVETLRRAPEPQSAEKRMG